MIIFRELVTGSDSFHCQTAKWSKTVNMRRAVFIMYRMKYLSGQMCHHCSPWLENKYNAVSLCTVDTHHWRFLIKRGFRMRYLMDGSTAWLDISVDLWLQGFMSCIAIHLWDTTSYLVTGELEFFEAVHLSLQHKACDIFFNNNVM